MITRAWGQNGVRVVNRMVVLFFQMKTGLTEIALIVLKRSCMLRVEFQMLSIFAQMFPIPPVNEYYFQVKNIHLTNSIRRIPSHIKIPQDTTCCSCICVKHFFMSQQNAGFIIIVQYVTSTLLVIKCGRILNIEKPFYWVYHPLAKRISLIDQDINKIKTTEITSVGFLTSFRSSAIRVL